MSLKNKTENISEFHEYGLHLPTRTLYIGSVGYDEEGEEAGIDYAMAEKVVKNLHVLDSISNEQITILINNIGGDIYHCFAIYDAVKKCRSKVKIVVIGQAMSSASIILQAADERIMTANSILMIHYGWLGASGHAKTTQKWAKEGQRIDLWMEKMYLKRIREKNPDFRIGRLKNMLDHDTILTAKESVEFGLADKILEE